MRCEGCGRLLGLRREEACPCWTAHSDQALIPQRLLRRTRQIAKLREERK